MVEKNLPWDICALIFFLDIFQIYFVYFELFSIRFYDFLFFALLILRFVSNATIYKYLKAIFKQKDRSSRTHDHLIKLQCLLSHQPYRISQKSRKRCKYGDS
jgi:hypothetical protein